MKSKSEEIKELAEALSQAQAIMKPAELNATNPYYNTRYADLGSIISVAREPLAKFGLSFTQLVSMEDNRIKLDTILMHKSGEWISTDISLPLPDKGGRTMAQEAGAILTYLRRYSLAAILGIYSEEDNDGNEPKAKKDPEKPVSKPAAAVQEPASKMSLEMAESVTNRDGISYGAIDTPKLSHMYDALVKSLKENHMTAEEREAHQMKRDAIETIMAARAKKNGA